MVLARRISRKKVVTKATPVGGGTEAERASETKDIRSLRSAVRQAEIRRLPEEISTINDKYLPREKSHKWREKQKVKEKKRKKKKKEGWK